MLRFTELDSFQAIVGTLGSMHADSQSHSRNYSPVLVFHAQVSLAWLLAQLSLAWPEPSCRQATPEVAGIHRESSDTWRLLRASLALESLSARSNRSMSLHCLPSCVSKVPSSPSRPILGSFGYLYQPN